ncbi:MAG: glycosyltransferase family 4 protein, partial [Antricoccus sp.]
PAEDLAAAQKLRLITAHTDVIHAHGLRAAMVAVAANAGRSIPLVVTLHNIVDVHNPILRRTYALIEGVIARRATVVLAASEDLAERAREVGGRAVLTHHVAAPPMAEPKRQRAEQRRALEVATDRPLLLCVGRLHRQKGYQTLLEAAAIWQPRADHPMTVIAGDGPLREMLTEQIRATGVDVQLLGRRTDVADLLQAADLVVLPSMWEARALVAQEAMRAGVPLVCTRTGGLPALVGDAASVVPVGDAAALAAAVTQILDDPQRARELAEAGRLRAAELETEEDTASELIDVYDRLLSGKQVGQL